MTSLDAFGDCLEHAPTAGAFALHQQLARTFADRARLPLDTWAFAPHSFAKDGGCTLQPDPNVASFHPFVWRNDQLLRSPTIGAFTIEWENAQNLTLIDATWSENGYTKRLHWVLAPTEAEARAFAETVCRWTTRNRKQYLVFDKGQFRPNRDLRRAVNGIRDQVLVLRPELRSRLFDDLTRFVAARDAYMRQGAPHKRGVLLHGPPGNGKSHCIKALCAHLDLSVLYVRTLRAKHRLEEESIQTVFEQARHRAPCVLVFEDLDTLIPEALRSVFLNELDGMHENDGLITIATTNHPERLDPALLHRPSRFDVKIRFDPPEAPERRTYLEGQVARLDDPPDIDLSAIVEATEGLSFAQLKEAFLGGLLRWLDGGDDLGPTTLRWVAQMQASTP